MNLPNKLTVSRIVLILPFFLVLYLDVPYASYIALAIFIIASLTDMLDGKIARKYNLITDFGKFADPLADKMLVTAAMVWFVEQGRLPGWDCTGVRCQRTADGSQRPGAGYCRRVVRKGKNRGHDGVPCGDVPAGAAGGGYGLCDGNRSDNAVFRRGVL